MIIEGKLLKGLGKASKAMATCIKGFQTLLGEPIVPGTFNIQTKKNIYLLNPTIRTEGSKFWKVKIIQPKLVEVWLYRWNGSVVPENQLQVLSQHRLRSYLGIGTNQIVTVDINKKHIKD